MFPNRRIEGPLQTHGHIRFVRRTDVPVVAVQAWTPPGGDLAERRCPSPGLRRVWAEAAGERLEEAVRAAWAASRGA